MRSAPGPDPIIDCYRVIYAKLKLQQNRFECPWLVETTKSNYAKPHFFHRIGPRAASDKRNSISVNSTLDFGPNRMSKKWCYLSWTGVDISTPLMTKNLCGNFF